MGFGLRALARELLDFVPVAGWAAKGASAYAGTSALGEAARKALPSSRPGRVLESAASWPPTPTGNREAHGPLLIEEADAWFEYADATKDQIGGRYAEIEPWAWARLQNRLRALAARRARLVFPEAA